MYMFSDDVRERGTELFKQYDGGTGVLQKAAFQAMVQDLSADFGLSATAADVDAVYFGMDRNKSGFVELDDFTRWSGLRRLVDRYRQRTLLMKLWQRYTVADTMNQSEFQAFAADLCALAGDVDSVSSMVSDAFTGGKRGLSFADFAVWCTANEVLTRIEDKDSHFFDST